MVQHLVWVRMMEQKVRRLKWAPTKEWEGMEEEEMVLLLLERRWKPGWLVCRVPTGLPAGSALRSDLESLVERASGPEPSSKVVCYG